MTRHSSSMSPLSVENRRLKVITQMFGHFPKIPAAHAIIVFLAIFQVDFGIEALFRDINVVQQYFIANCAFSYNYANIAKSKVT